MNIFVLNRDPIEAARDHCDKHVVKMIVESAQMLSTAHRYHDSMADDKVLYKTTHLNHPCTKWTLATAGNYQWLRNLFEALCDEYTVRYGRVHKTQVKLESVLKKLPRGISLDGVTDHPLCMPDQYKVSADPVECYRAYYVGEKNDFARWAHTSPPLWWSKNK